MATDSQSAMLLVASVFVRSCPDFEVANKKLNIEESVEQPDQKRPRLETAVETKRKYATYHEIYDKESQDDQAAQSGSTPSTWHLWSQRATSMVWTLFSIRVHTIDVAISRLSVRLLLRQLQVDHEMGSEMANLCDNPLANGMPKSGRALLEDCLCQPSTHRHSSKQRDPTQSNGHTFTHHPMNGDHTRAVIIHGPLIPNRLLPSLDRPKPLPSEATPPRRSLTRAGIAA
ncbi:hypothetical protein JB92DRAFT_3094614 [Gautieria morchelliformis]|nr:hypothetical protein JB92DRAFT_3094614 [Gautieria morchelliformis]